MGVVTDLEWQSYLNTLPPELADLAGHLMERINTVLNRERSRALDEAQHLGRRMDVLAQRISDLVVRLELYEEQRASDVQASLARFAEQQLAPEQVQKLLGEVYRLGARLPGLEQRMTTLEQRQVGGADVERPR